MKKFSLLTTIVVFASLAFCGWAEDKKAERAKLEGDATAAIEVFKKTDPGLSAVFEKAAGYVVFPNVGKGGFVVGGAHGNGIVWAGGKLVGYASLTQVTVGAQIGGQAFSEVIFFETADVLATFKKSEFAMSAQVSAVAAAEGASKNAKYVEGVMVFTKAKQGLMAEASVGGQKFKFEPVEK
jgi:lipid-binding SYLF domain-containing protein